MTKIKNSGRDFFRPAETSDRMPRQHIGATLLVASNLLGQIGFNNGRADRIHPDAFRGKLEGC